MSSDSFNRSELLEEFDNDLELLSKLLGIFRTDCESRLSKINAVLEAGDFPALSNEAHAIKSGVGNFFATGAYRAASELETLAAEGSADAAEKSLRELEGEIAKLIVALEEVCGSA